MSQFAPGVLEPIHNPALTDPITADRYLEGLGLHVDDMNYVWETKGYEQAKTPLGDPDPETLTTEQYRSNCLQRIYKIEQAYPGSAKRLAQEHKIYNYGRMPLRTLMLQADPTPRRYSRRIWVGVALYDNNGAFLDALTCLDAAHYKLPDDVQLTVDELMSPDDVVEQLNRRAYEWQHDDFGPDTAQVITFMGHGTEEDILLSRFNGGRSITSYEIDKKSVACGIGEAIVKASSPLTTVFLDACKSARGNYSIGEVIHSATNLHVVGARQDVSNRFMRFIPKGPHKLDVVPGFYTATPQGNAVVEKRSPARHFRPQQLHSIAATQQTGYEPDLASAA